MRVLHFYKRALPESMGGVEQVIDQVAQGTGRLGVEVDVLALGQGGENGGTAFHGYTSYRTRTDFELASTGFSFSAFAAFARLAKQADVVHYHFPWPFMDLVHFVSRVGKPSVVTYHSDIIRQKHLLKLYRPLQSLFLGQVDRIISTSPNYAQTSQTLAPFRSKVEVIPIGLDRSSYPVARAERLDYWRKRFGGRFFLFVGVLRYYKGLHILLDAMALGELPVVIIGAGPVERALHEQANRLGLCQVHFLGFVDDEDKVALQSLCLAVVFPSFLRSEAFGVALLEGAMFGKPMICCEIGTGTSFINIAGETGLVVPPGDPVALRGAMQYLWDNPGEVQRMGMNAERRYVEHFTADTMARRHLAVYQELAGEAPRAGR